MMETTNFLGSESTISNLPELKQLTAECLLIFSAKSRLDSILFDFAELNAVVFKVLIGHGEGDDHGEGEFIPEGDADDIVIQMIFLSHCL